MNAVSDRFENLAQLMREKAPEYGFGKGVGVEEVARCEEQLGVGLPKSYKQFLQSFGFARWPEDVYGVYVGSTPGLQVVWNTETERHEVEPEMPYYLIPFSPDGWGNHYCMDTSRLVDGECPVVFWNHELDEDQQPPQTHTTFLDWLEERVTRELENESDDGSPS
jgi:cell wall assembly regulator SMI1